MIMDKYYKAESCREDGTLFQLKNLINRRNVAKDVSNNYHPDSAFFDLVVDCHIIEGSLVYCGMENINSQCKKIPTGLHLADKELKRRILLQLVGEIVDNFFLNPVTLNMNRLEDMGPQRDEAVNQDRVYNYATNITKLGLLRRVVLIATRYGDGERVLRHWKYAMLLYHQAHKTKYKLDSFLLLAGVNALFTPRQRQQVMHNRFVNLSGREGHNLDGDYVMELLNRYAKSRIRLLGPNHSADCVDRIGKTMMFCHDIQEKLEHQIKVAPSSRFHKGQNLTKDRDEILKQLRAARVLKYLPGRVHHTFPFENVDIFSNIDVREIHKWIKGKKSEYHMHKFSF